MHLRICFIALCCCFVTALSAQEVSPDSTGKKPWYLTFALDLKFKGIAGSMHSSYEGEYLDTRSSARQSWQWVHHVSDREKLLGKSYFISPKLDVLLSRSRSLKVGMSWNFGILEYRYTVVDSSSGQPFTYPASEFNSWLAISALGEYYYYFKKNASASPFIYGSLALGYYRATAEISGPGKEWFGQLHGGLGYRNKKDWFFRAYVSSDFLRYRERLTSPIFQREQKYNVNLNLLYFGVGVAKQFTLIPD